MNCPDSLWLNICRKLQWQTIQLQNFLTNPKKERITNIRKKERKERVDEILAYFDLENIKKQKIGQLSYQEKILVELSRELVKKPELLILDEVFEKLKKNNKEKLLKHLYKINEEGTTVIAVTSEENLFDERIRVIDLDGGKTDVESD